MLKTPWRAELLGRVTLRCGEEVHDRFRERKMVALFALLSRQERRSLTRHELVETLWPDESPDVSRNRFRVTLHHLRHLLEPLGVTPGSVLQTGREDIGLHPAAFTSDVNDFVTLLDDADKCAEASERVGLREQALALYRGEFLPGFEDAWAIQERDMLAQRHFYALRGVTRDLLALKETGRGLIWAREAVEREPLEEEAWFDLMRLYAGDGQLSEALRQYEQFRLMLARELGVQPSAATQKLADVLQTHLGHQVKTPAPDTKPRAPKPKQAANTTAAHVEAAPDPASNVHAPAPRSGHDAAPTLPALPVRLTRFFGRERDVTTLCALLTLTPLPDATIMPAADAFSHPDTDDLNALHNELDDLSQSDIIQLDVTRLVTLLGPGGMGKTRLALEVGERLSREYAGRVWFVGMEDAVSSRQLDEALQNALRLPHGAKIEPFAQTLAVLNQAPSLLILDNLEHLLPEVSAPLMHLLTNAPGLRCLVTSRRSVGLEGEREYALSPLALPDPDAPLSTLREYAGVALFADRARARRADFALTAHNAPDVLRLCSLLDGLPLALELAAARIRVMSAHEMCAQFTDVLEWLVDTRGGKEARHRSLRAAIAWSYRMLGSAARQCWQLCSVFAGGFTGDMAAWMCAPVLPDRGDVLLTLDELCAASLLTAREGEDGVTRFAMLESLRAFAHAQSEQDGAARQAQKRHLQWAEQQIQTATADEETYFAFARRESANLRAALTYGLNEQADADDQERAAQLALLLPDHWRTQGSLTEGREWMRQLLRLPVSDAVMASARLADARMAVHQGDYDMANALAAQSVEIAQAQNDTPSVADGRYTLGLAAFHQGHYPQAQAHIEAALANCDTREDSKLRAERLSSLGLVAWYQGDHATARRHVEDALAIQRLRGSRRGIAVCLQRLGNIVRDRGDLDAGKILIWEALETFRALHDTVGVADSLHGLGLIARFQGDNAHAQEQFVEAQRLFHAAGLKQRCAVCLHNLAQIELNLEHWESGRVLMQEALDVHRQFGDRRGIANALHSIALVEQGAGRLAQALALLREALAMDREMGSPVSVAQHLHSLGSIQADLGDMAASFAFLREAVAIIRTLEVRADLACVLRTWASLLAAQGQARLAARVSGAVTAYYRTVSFAPTPHEERKQTQTLAALRSELGEQTLTHHWQQGENLSLEQAADEIEGAEAEQKQ